MRVSIFGLGYVGCVSAACLAQDGHTVIGVDIDPFKVSQIQAERSPVIEPGLDELVREGVRSGRLRAMHDSYEAVVNSDVSLICVGTPSSENGRLKLDYVEKVSAEIGRALALKQTYHVVVVRSTVLPGTVQDRVIPVLKQHSGRCPGADFGVSMNPEFLREGCAIHDYFHPSHIVIGEIDSRSGDAVEALYTSVDARVIRTTLPVAEMVKYVNNAFHALKVAFANEVGNLCKAQGLDGQEVMAIFVQDQRLNLSPAYLRPGFAFGGSCLPKDLRALNYRAKELDLSLPVMDAILDSNEKQVQLGIKIIERTGKQKIGILGLSFKAGTDDIRESPIVPLVETLVGRGYQVSIYDETVVPDQLIGANRAFLERGIPHIASLMRSSVDEVVDEAETVVIANDSATYRAVAERARHGQILIDFIGIAKRNDRMRARYEGICW